MKPEFILFTDGSVEKHTPRGSAGCGFVIVDVLKGEFSLFSEQVLAHKDKILNSAFIEIVAVLYGIRKLKKIAPEGSKILIVSDNLMVVNIFNHNLKHNWSLPKRKDWTDKRGYPVLGQKQLREIINICYDGRYKIRVIHIHSHTNRNITIPRKAIRQIQNDLEKYNVTGDSDVSDSFIPELFIQFNRLADLCAKAGTKHTKKRYKGRKLQI